MLLFTNLILFLNLFNGKLSKKIYSKKYLDGYDLRNSTYIKENNITLSSMKRIFYKKYILDKLNSSISIQTKLQYIDEYIDKDICPNIFNGGLMDKWNF